MATGVQLGVIGTDYTVQMIKAMDPIAYRHLLRAARKSVEPVRAEAASNAPIQTGAMSQSYKVKKARARGNAGARVATFGYAVVAEGPGARQAAILEFAGSKSSGHTPQGTSLIRSLTSTYGQPGRFAWDAMDRNSARVTAAFGTAIRDAEVEMNARLGKVA
jgi:hypothetical protein